MLNKVLVVENGPFEAKHPFIQRVKQHSHSKLLINTNREPGVNGWFNEYYTPEDVLSANLTRPSRAVRQLSGLNGHFDGVFTFLEEAVPVTQALAHSFSLPTITNGDIRALRNKELMRQTLKGIGVKQPRFIPCSSFSKALAAVGEIGVPCVIKPVEMGSSLGVKYIDGSTTLDQFKSWYDFACECDFPDEYLRKFYGLSSKVMIEEFIDAPTEISVEAVSFHGEIDIIAITRKFLGPLPDFEEIGHITAIELEPHRIKEIEEILRKISKGFALNNTMLHVELKLPSNEEAVFIEAGGRLGGGLIPIIAEEATGVNLVKVGLDIACDKSPEIVPSRKECASIMFITNQAMKQRVLDELYKIQRLGVIKFYDGATQDRLGHIIFNGASEEKILEMRTEVMKIIELP